MKSAILVTCMMTVLFCQPCSSNQIIWETNDALNASVQGGEGLNVSTGLTKYISISDYGMDKTFDSQLMANEVKDIYMNGSAFLTLKDENDHVNANNMAVMGSLTLLNKSNMAMKFDGGVNISNLGEQMKRAALVTCMMTIFVCQPCSSNRNIWETNDALNANVQGGEGLNISTDLIKYISISDSGIDKTFDSQLMANDVKNICMNSSAFLILKDENDHVYTNSLVIKNNLTLPNESNVVMNHDGDINISKSDPSSPSVSWWTALEFPDSLDLKMLELNSSMDLTPDQDLNYISTYMGRNNIAYTTGSETQFSDSNEGVTIKWGEGQNIIMGGS